jgi:hypothetical protein
MTESPQIRLSLLQMARNIIGNDNVSSIKLIKGDETLHEYTYSNTSMDKIPSVLFSLSDILPPEKLISEVSEDFKDRVYLTKSKFPGII